MKQARCQRSVRVKCFYIGLRPKRSFTSHAAYLSSYSYIHHVPTAFPFTACKTNCERPDWMTWLSTQAFKRAKAFFWAHRRRLNDISLCWHQTPFTSSRLCNSDPQSNTIKLLTSNQRPLKFPVPEGHPWWDSSGGQFENGINSWNGRRWSTWPPVAICQPRGCCFGG